MTNPENLKGQGFHTNPERISGGRPKGSLNRSTIARRWLEAKGAIEGITVADEVFLAQIEKAKKGDTMAFNAVMDSAMGKLVEKSEVAVTALPESREAVVSRLLERKK